MKKKMFRERYATIEENAIVEEKPVEVIEEVKPKKRGRKKSVKSDK